MRITITMATLRMDVPLTNIPMDSNAAINPDAAATGMITTSW